MSQQEAISISIKHEELTTTKISGLFMKYAIPGVFGLLFLGIQTVIDGIILSHFVGAKALASVSLILPCYNFMIAVAVVTGIGCQTLVGLRLGQANRTEANHALTTAFTFLSVFSILMSTLIFVFAEQIALLLGANEVLLEGSVKYIHSIVPFFPILSLMFFGDYIMKISGRPVYATIVMTSTVIINIILDLFFITQLGWGIAGAGLGTGIAFTIGLLLNGPNLFNYRQTLCVRKGKFKARLLGQILYNGSSEGISELSAGISIFMFNLVLMRYIGEIGVAAFSALEYVLFIGTTIFLGISDGIIPIMSYNFGNGRVQRVISTLLLAAKTNLTIGISLFIILLVAGKTIVAAFFKSSDTEILEMAIQGASLYAFAFLCNGLNILASGYFTSIGNAKTSVIISLLRGIIFIIPGLLIFPGLLGIKGIWIVIPVAEFCTIIVSFLLVRRSIRKQLTIPQ